MVWGFPIANYVWWIGIGNAGTFISAALLLTRQPWRAAINRFGFNNDGAEAIAARLAEPRPAGVVGLNLGANKDSADRAADFAATLARAGAHVDFATVNVSSPNTPGLRDLADQPVLGHGRPVGAVEVLDLRTP